MISNCVMLPKLVNLNELLAIGIVYNTIYIFEVKKFKAFYQTKHVDINISISPDIRIYKYKYISPDRTIMMSSQKGTKVQGTRQRNKFKNF